MMSALKTKNIPESLPSLSYFSASFSGPAVPNGSSSIEHVILMPYYMERNGVFVSSQPK